MSVAYRLGKDEGEIASWPLRRLVRWMAYFKIVREEEDKAIERAKKTSFGNFPKGSGV
jgi:hypothetical protein